MGPGFLQSRFYTFSHSSTGYCRPFNLNPQTLNPEPTLNQTLLLSLSPHLVVTCMCGPGRPDVAQDDEAQLPSGPACRAEGLPKGSFHGSIRGTITGLSLGLKGFRV